MLCCAKYIHDENSKTLNGWRQRLLFHIACDEHRADLGRSRGELDRRSKSYINYEITTYHNGVYHGINYYLNDNDTFDIAHYRDDRLNGPRYVFKFNALIIYELWRVGRTHGSFYYWTIDNVLTTSKKYYYSSLQTEYYLYISGNLYCLIYYLSNFLRGQVYRLHDNGEIEYMYRKS